MLHIDFWKLGLDEPRLKAWFGGMYESFFHALECAGAKVTLSRLAPNKEADVLVIPVGGGHDKVSARAMGSFGEPIILYVPPASAWFRRGFLERWREYILFTYGTDCSDLTPQSYRTLGIDYYHLPMASDPEIMRPLDLPRQYDVVFVGNPRSGSGRHRYVSVLMEAAQNRRVLLVGPGWERYGYPYQCVAWGDLLNLIYNTALVCVNIMNDEQRVGSHYRLDANNRLFDLAMAGRFQISNAPEVVRRYFDDSEVLAFDTPEEWVAAILYHLDHPSQTDSYRVAARSRALAEHTWDHRATRFMKLVRSSLDDWRKEPRTTSLLLSAVRYRDTTLPPHGVTEMVCRVGSRLLGRIRRLTDSR